MKHLIMIVAALCSGCASTTFHEGRTTLAKGEQEYLRGGKGSGKGAFERYWQATNLRPWGLVKWQEERSWAVPDAPLDLLQTVRDELGRLNQRAGAGDNLQIAVTVYRFEKAGTWSKPTAYYEVVARDPHGKVVWAADDKVRVVEELAQSLVETPSSIIAREILRKVREQFGI